MINRKLLETVKESRKYIGLDVLFQWISLAANIFLMILVTGFIQLLYTGNVTRLSFFTLALGAAGAAAVRFLMTRKATKMGYLASREVKKTLREKIYRKLLKLGASYSESVSTSEVVQVTVEGTQQLETYFSAYLPQFFYSMLAPVTLFAVLSFISFRAAIILMVCVPLIPVSIAAVQTWAKKLLSKYWNQYTALGDTFLENLQGLTTLKIYKTDGMKNDQMNEEAEKFRKITMKVLTMQLNSITIMDLVAYGGAALGIIIALIQFRAGDIDVAGALLIILLSAEFFIPMRMLGSYFHVAMNGMAAWDKIEKLLMLTEDWGEKVSLDEGSLDIYLSNVSFSYDSQRDILKDINMNIPDKSFIAIAGESGSGKYTVASIMSGSNRGYAGSIKVGGKELSSVGKDSLMKEMTTVSHNSYLFKGTVRDNLLMGNREADDERLMDVLKQVNMYDFIRESGGLDFVLSEKGGNLSGGQCQRLCLARAILHDSPVYIFDEATSNIDVESENLIMEQIKKMAGEKTVIVISHRLANITDADRIYVLEKGRIAETGNHKELVEKNGSYARMWKVQQNLENVGRRVSYA